MTKSQISAAKLATEDAKAREADEFRAQKKRARMLEKGLDVKEKGARGGGSYVGAAHAAADPSAPSVAPAKAPDRSAAAELEVSAAKMKAEGVTLAQVRKVRERGEGSLSPPSP